MIDLSKDIHSLSDFQRNTKEHILRLKESGRPEVLTVNGKAEVVVQAADAYQKILEALEQLETTVGIRQGLESINDSKGRLAKDVFKDLEGKHTFLFCLSRKWNFASFELE
jgi:PHD/YefM family antitoxin component YafN of YafNO toxin-antitoxin module